MSKQKWLSVPCVLVFVVIGYFVLSYGEKKQSTEDLIAGLKSKDERDRITAVRTLPTNGENAARVVPALIEALKDRQPDVRLSAAIKLGTIGEPARDALPGLKEALNDRDARVRKAASTAIQRIDPSAAPQSPPVKGEGE
jgi:hypothetical protein